MEYLEDPPYQTRPAAMYNHPELIDRLLGFTGVTVLAQLQSVGFDPIIDYPYDAMHLVALGLIKASIKYMFSKV